MKTAACLAGTASLSALLLLQIVPAAAQGIIPGKPQAEDVTGTRLASLATLTPDELTTTQKLLERLGYLQPIATERPLDAATLAGIGDFLAASGWSATAPDKRQLFRALYSALWAKEGWSLGTGQGQTMIVGATDVLLAQQILDQLGFEPGPIDGRFGPATMTAVARFESENGLKVTGLLTSPVLGNITRSTKFIAEPPKATIRILSAEGVIDPAALEGFENATRIRVLHDTYDKSNETRKLLMAGSSNYDLMVQAGAEMRQILEKQGSVTKIDRVKIPNSNTLDTASQIYTEALDPLNAHSIPYLWGTVGISTNKDLVDKILPDTPVNSMALLFDPKNAAALSSCGIAIIDEPIDVVPSFVSYVGGDFRNVGVTDLEAVDAALSQIKGFVKVVPKAEFVDGLSSGRYCVGLGYSGDALVAREISKAKQTGTIAYVVPKEGSELWFQLLVIPKNAKNPEASHQLIDYLLKPEVAAAGTKTLMYANTVHAAGPLMEAQLLNDPGLYPPRDVMGRLYIQPPLPADVEQELDRIWAKFKG
jgi:putrescine transport system substrate-binding protein